ncbi:GH32 C-terminal domain-containing protein [Pseudarthrobacter oxydans]|uniref:GH32 C-terminal domain-containing protein n=1 Tax=Pseudarthrobacter oxydans TaxID=1671 RepID=UPI0034500D15
MTVPGASSPERGAADQHHRRRNQSPIGPSAGRLILRVLVDLTSVEMFLGDGRVVHPHRVFPLKGDSGIPLRPRNYKLILRRQCWRRMQRPGHALSGCRRRIGCRRKWRWSIRPPS